MITRRAWMRKVAMAAPSAALIAPVLVRAGQECDCDDKCVAGISRDTIEEVKAKQKATNWCWAACAQMILNYYKVPIDQEQIVERIKGSKIDEPAYPKEAVLSMTGPFKNQYGYYSLVSTNVYRYPLKAAQIVKALTKDRPLMVGYMPIPNASIGHMVVITAVEYEALAGGGKDDVKLLSFIVRDPWPDNPSRRVFNADEFVPAINSFYTIAVRHLLLTK